MTTNTTPFATTIAGIVSGRLVKLQNGYLRDRSASVATLARLRRGVGKPTGSVLDIVEHTHAEEFVYGWDSDEPSFAENAAHAAMTLYAVHQQSQRTAMHVPGRRFGAAVRDLATDPDPDKPVGRRFAALGTADSFTELSHHLRGMVQLMRTARVTLDYGQLTRDLWLWQLPGRAPQVRLRWGRDFHFPPKNDRNARPDSPIDAEDTQQ